jgi:hypothetical protein
MRVTQSLRSCPVTRPEVVAVLTLLFAATATADITPGRAHANDSTRSGIPSAIATYFLSGEAAASWHTSPCNGSIVGVQVYWASIPGNTRETTEESITFYSAGAFPAPGGVLRNVDSSVAIVSLPVLQDGEMNEFRYLDPTANSIAIDIPVTAGQVFSVGIALRNESAGSQLAPSIASDMDGCQAYSNTVDVNPDGWSDACALGIAGDWVMRPIVVCSDEAGAAVPPSSNPPAMRSLR